MIDQPYFDHSPSFEERICLGILASSFALFTTSLVLMNFFMG